MCKKLEKMRAVDLEAYGSKNPEGKKFNEISWKTVYKK
jgi:hypothetical protein